jgi:hypothetical protein
LEENRLPVLEINETIHESLTLHGASDLDRREVHRLVESETAPVVDDDTGEALAPGGS